MGAFSKWVGWGITFLGMSLIYNSSIGRPPSVARPDWPELLVFFGVFATGLFISMSGMRSEQNAADDHAKGTFGGWQRPDDGGPYSLFLRTFDLTGKMTLERPASNPFSWDQYDRPGKDALERLFADALARTAPLIGLGGHGDVELGPGLAGFIENWHERVENAMKHAAYIFVIPSANEGTLWEIGILKSQDYFEKTVFIMPPSVPPFKFTGDGQYKDFWEAARLTCASELHIELPPYREKGGIFLMKDRAPIRGKSFAGFDPRSVARTINSLMRT